MAHDFGKRQLELMKYFAVRYECLDARDDYSAKRDKENEDNISYQWATPDMMTFLDDSHLRDTIEGAEMTFEDQQAEEDGLGVLGRQGKFLRDGMAAAERTMIMAGWLDGCVDGLPDVGEVQPIQPEADQSAKQWRVAVLARKQDILNERNKNLPSMWWM